MASHSSIVGCLPRHAWWASAVAGLCACLSCAVRSPSPGSSSITIPKGPLARLEQSLVFAPLKFPGGDWSPPQDLNLEEVQFAASDGTRLHGWFCPSHLESPRAVVLYCHGNGGNVSYCTDVLRDLRALGASTMAFDYRGYGKSEGVPDEAGILADARAARAWLAGRAGVAEREIVLMGRSLGGGVATDLAAQDGARGLVLESTFTSVPTVAGANTSRPVAWLVRTRLNSLEKIARYHGPLLISHGDADQLIPYDHGKQLFAAAPGPKRFITIAGGGHNDPQSAEYFAALDSFFGEVPRQD